MRWIGIDGARGGWVAAIWNGSSLRLVRLPRLADLFPLDGIAAIDMPIGLPERIDRGGRACDRAARQILKHRGACVFPPPARPALAAATYSEANSRNRAASAAGTGLPKQTYNLFPLIRDADAALTPARQAVAREAHPELAFLRLNDGLPVDAPKRGRVGRAVRQALLARSGLPDPAPWLDQARALNAAPDDILDACALAVTARRISEGMACRLPDAPERDGRGLRMEIWY